MYISPYFINYSFKSNTKEMYPLSVFTYNIYKTNISPNFRIFVLN